MDDDREKMRALERRRVTDELFAMHADEYPRLIARHYDDYLSIIDWLRAGAFGPRPSERVKEER